MLGIESISQLGIDHQKCPKQKPAGIYCFGATGAITCYVQKITFDCQLCIDECIEHLEEIARNIKVCSRRLLD